MAENINLDGSSKGNLILRHQDTEPVAIQLLDENDVPTNLDGFTYELEVFKAPYETVTTLPGTLDIPKEKVTFNINAAFWAALSLNAQYYFRFVRKAENVHKTLIHGDVTIRVDE